MGEKFLMGYVVAGIIVIVIIQAVAILMVTFWKWILLIAVLYFAARYFSKNKIIWLKLKVRLEKLRVTLFNQIRSTRKKLYYYFSPEVKKNHWEFICSEIKKVEIAVQAFREFQSFKTYFDRYQLEGWNKTYRPIILGFTRDIGFLLKQHPSYSSFQEFSRYLEHGEGMRVEYNRRYVQKSVEQNKEFFDVIEKQPLTLRQREAVVIDDHRNLVIAGAGTGKTSTLVAKFAFLVEKLNAHPEKILMLAFNKDAAEEIRVRSKSRIKKILHKDVDVNVSTFHSFGFQIIKEFEILGKGSIEVERDESLREIFRQRSNKDGYVSKLAEYFLRHYVYTKSFIDFESIEEYEKFKRESKGLDTILGERVDSCEERQIADFLFMNRIKYVWNKEYPINTVTDVYRKQYQPDFYLPDYDIYIEHWGVGEPDETGSYTVPRWFRGRNGLSGRDTYLEGMAWKKALHEEHTTKLIETFSFESKKEILFKNLSQKLMDNGVKVNPMSPRELLDYIKANFPERYENFFELVVAFMSIAKANLIDMQEVRKRFDLNRANERMRLFLDIYEDLYLDYDEYLRRNQKIDFDEMISSAVKYLEDNPTIRLYDYILVDEFQDLSYGRYQLLSALLKNNPSCKLFAVGDDWQSIYRFTGSDISFITKFEKHFGPCEQILLDKTFRYNDQILDLSRRFVQKNPFQIKKNELSTDAKATSRVINIIPKRTKGDGLLQHICETLDKECKEANKKSSMFILNRRKEAYNFDKNEFRDAYKNIDISFKTVHASKGLEADIVVIDNVDEYIFPSEVITDEILRELLPTSENFEFAEERRLFYVALTRTKEKVYILGQEKKLSCFFREIKESL